MSQADSHPALFYQDEELELNPKYDTEFSDALRDAGWMGLCILQVEFIGTKLLNFSAQSMGRVRARDHNNRARRDSGTYVVTVQLLQMGLLLHPTEPPCAEYVYVFHGN